MTPPCPTVGGANGRGKPQPSTTTKTSRFRALLLAQLHVRTRNRDPFRPFFGPDEDVDPHFCCSAQLAAICSRGDQLSGDETR
ncbi:hypothetical protein Q1695_009469 [Nippostrongylus brasiliensis]|nr:hypothetical protein Q1695_009469 [Nippostrongylus brasiliensis]